jgi:NitT/TauT family transport system substrate-binding protein
MQHTWTVPQRPARGRLLAAALGAISIIVAACGGGATGSPTTSASATPGGAASAAPTGGLTRLVVGLGYIPSVQFAQFYLADQAGYYAAAGVAVEFQNKIDPELVTLVGQGAVDVGIADGTSVLPAVSQDIPIKYLMTIYAQFPNVVVAKASSGIKTAADLKGKRIGVPGRYGSSWIQLQALLASVNLTTSDVTIVLFPDYGQLTALEQGAVDAAAGYANNEPIRLAETGETAVTLALPADQQLPGPGLISGTATLASKHDAILAFAQATRRAMADIAADPTRGLDAAIARVPELASQRDAQLAVLKATVTQWKSDYTAANGWGALDTSLWEHAITFMGGLPDKYLAKAITAADCIDASFLPHP